MKRLLMLSSLLVSGCALSQVQSDQVLTTVNQIANTAISDLTTGIAVANAATPPDQDGARCGEGAITIARQVQNVLAATPAGGTVGAFTTAEIASLYVPGSAQYNEVVTTLETACIAKVHDINQSINSAVGVMAAIPTILALAAPVK